jgi:hypothetical protein
VQTNSLIARTPGGSAPPHWNKHVEQVSGPQTLTAGKEYYIAALSVGTAGDATLAAGVRLPSGEDLRPIPVSGGSVLSSRVEAPRVLGTSLIRSP